MLRWEESLGASAAVMQSANVRRFGCSFLPRKGTAAFGAQPGGTRTFVAAQQHDCEVFVGG